MFPSALFHQMGVNGKVSGGIFAINEIPDAIAIVHGAVGCGYHYRYSARTRNYPVSNLLSSNLKEMDIVLGGEQQLYNTIISAYEKLNPSLIVIVPTPVSDIIQDDLFAVAKRANALIDGKVIVSKSELFSHRDKNYSKKRLKMLSEQNVTDPKSLDIDIIGCGYSEVLCALVEQVMKPCDIALKTVNIETIAWGVHGNQILDEIASTLEKVGVKVNAYLPSASSSVIETMPSAELNIVRRNHWAKKMRDKFGTPFLELQSNGRYDGITGVCNFYRDIGNVLDVSSDMENIISYEHANVLRSTDMARKYIGSHKVYMITNSLSNLPTTLKIYKETYNLNIYGVCVNMTDQAIKNSDLHGDMLKKLVARAEMGAKIYYQDIEIKLNLDIDKIKNECSSCDFIIGTENPYYECFEKPILSMSHDPLSLSFASVIRSINAMEFSMKTAKTHSKMILNKMDFTLEYYPLIEEKNIIASRQMWNKMWLQRGEHI